MGRPAYKITPEDFEAARKYVVRMYGSDYPEVRHISTPFFLQEWCEDKLHQDQWKKLKATILQERKRGRDEAKRIKVKNITITERAWMELARLQRNLAEIGEQVTYSELIEAMAEKLTGVDARSALRKLEIQRKLPEH